MALFRPTTPTPPDGMAKQRPLPTANPAEQHNIIGTNSTVEGTLRASGNVHVAGTVNGNVEVDGRTVVMPGGTVDGQLASTNAEVGGHVKGEVTVRERLVLKPTAVIDGDIRTQKLVIEEGATLNGRCQMGGTPAVSAPAAPDRPRRRVGGAPEAAE